MTIKSMTTATDTTGVVTPISSAQISFGIQFLIFSRHLINMIITTLTAAVSVIQVGGLAAAGVLPLTLIPAVVLYATIGTSEMELGTTDYVVASLSTATVALYFALIGYFIGYFRLESYFDSFPWKQESVKTGAHTWRCPFTGRSSQSPMILVWCL